MSGVLIFDNSVASVLDRCLDSMEPANVFVISDTTTSRLVVPKLIERSVHMRNAKHIVVSEGDINKNIEELTRVWSFLTHNGATRKSVIVNVGGGVVTDLGGFASATFKRGVRFVNIPTTLLSAVDASVGGKTGINFESYKNEIGVFRQADAVIVSTCFFDTLSEKEFLSGYAEMIKHSLLSGGKDFEALTGNDFPDKRFRSSDDFLEMLRHSVAVKQSVVNADPEEKGFRRVLNFGHTVGHAFETFAMNEGNPVPHGYAVAWGMVVELILSHLKFEFPSTVLYRLKDFVLNNYGIFHIDCDDYSTLLSIIGHDKKNICPGSHIMALLRMPGSPVESVDVSADDIRNAFDIYRDLFGV